MTIHRLKCWPKYYEAVISGEKTFEVRLNDRGFSVDDWVILEEWNPDDRHYTYRDAKFRITYVMSLKDYADVKGWGWRIARSLMPNLVILGIVGDSDCLRV